MPLSASGRGWGREFQQPVPYRGERLYLGALVSKRGGGGLPLVSAKPATTRRSPGPTEPCTECRRFLLSSGSERGECYWVVRFIGLIPDKARNPCRTLVACLVQTHPPTHLRLTKTGGGCRDWCPGSANHPPSNSL